MPHQPDDQIDIMEGFYPRGGDNRPNETSIYMTYHWANECGKDLYDYIGRYPKGVPVVQAHSIIAPASACP